MPALPKATSMPAPKVPFPAATAPANPVEPQANARPLHPAVQEHVAAWNETAKRLDQVLAENQQLRNDLEVERRHRQELEHQLDKAGNDRDFFMRYAVEVQTHLENIASSAIAARNRALEVARSEHDASADADPVDTLDENITKIAQAFGAGHKSANGAATAPAAGGTVHAR